MTYIMRHVRCVIKYATMSVITGDKLHARCRSMCRFRFCTQLFTCLSHPRPSLNLSEIVHTHEPHPYLSDKREIIRKFLKLIIWEEAVFSQISNYHWKQNQSLIEKCTYTLRVLFIQATI